MSVEAENKALVRRWHRSVWTGEDDIFDEALAPDAIFHGIGGPEETRAAITGMRSALGDVSLAIEDMIVEGDRVVTRWTLRGTHDGELWGIAPTGTEIEYTGITVNRLANGKIIEDWFEASTLQVLQQIGALPAPAA
jgi:predicted ester cyclase